MSRRNQLQWVALLAVAVVLPTVSLLWFMSRVVANERLAIHQKLTEFYEDKLADAAERAASALTMQLQSLEKISPDTNPYAVLKTLLHDGAVQGFVLWTDDGLLVYPRSDGVAGISVSPEHPLSGAWQLEFSKRQFAEAAAAYSGFTNDDDVTIAASAVLGRSRCLLKLRQFPEAIDECERAAAFDAADVADPRLRGIIANARLLLLSLLQQSPSSTRQTELYRRTLEALRRDVFNADGSRPRLPATQNLLVARKLVEAMQNPIGGSRPHGVDELEKLAGAEELSMLVADCVQPAASPGDQLFRVEAGDQQLYGLQHRNDTCVALALFSPQGAEQLLDGYRSTFDTRDSAYRILDAAGTFVAGAASLSGKPFAVASLPDGFPGWKIELHFKGSDVFQRAADRRIAVYLWTGALVILLILVAAGLAIQAVSRQIRLNRMKNDFIATVSHELKTPLASMRVLVDTLLEGNIRDDAQARQYLGLAAKENERLSRMIDNFLTFSRMERNKIAFTMADTNAADIVRDAVEAVRTKFAVQHCPITLDVDSDLPPLHADHDAIVTVLVNLLDNACKYTGAEKRIALKVSDEQNAVCFAVSDNGIGLARRHLRRIFDRFYQVDSSLARRAEGCGLGLSIVKFIVDAHKGKVTVESKPGKGSTFYVRLPANRKDGGEVQAADVAAGNSPGTS